MITKSVFDLSTMVRIEKNALEMELKIDRLFGIGLILKWLILIASCFVFVGWLLDIETLKKLVIGDNAMNPMTAFLFILLSSALLFKQSKSSKASPSLLAIFGLIMAISICRLLQIKIGFPIQIDHLFFGKLWNGQDDGVNPMAPAAAVLFILITLAKFARSANRELIGELLLIFSFTGILFMIAGYAFQVPEFYSSIKLFPALQSCLLFLMIVIAILFSSPTQGVVGLLSTDLEGSRVGRYLIGFTIAGPIGIAYLRMLAQRHHLISSEMGVAIVMSGYILIFTICLLETANSLIKSCC